jgi:hypothetical protein
LKEQLACLIDVIVSVNELCLAAIEFRFSIEQVCRRQPEGAGDGRGRATSVTVDNDALLTIGNRQRSEAIFMSWASSLETVGGSLNTFEPRGEFFGGHKPAMETPSVAKTGVIFGALVTVSPRV